MWRVALLVSTLGCNDVFGLDRTKLVDGGGPPDFDGDGVADRDDNCPFVPNPAQANADLDGFGDACDACPALATANNHDEDGDGIGDECDGCPLDVDFQVDTDQDTVGDACDFITDTNQGERLVAFDPFVSLGPDWSAGTTPWIDVGDAIAPTAVLDATDVGLQYSAIVLSTSTPSNRWWVRTSVHSTRPWQVGDRFGIGFVVQGTLLGGCLVECAGTKCSLHVRHGTAEGTPITFAPQPLVHIQALNVAGDLTCFIETTTAALAGTNLPELTPSLVGQPTIQFRSFAVWR